MRQVYGLYYALMVSMLLLFASYPADAWATEKQLFFHWQGASGNTEILQAAGFQMPEKQRTSGLLDHTPDLTFTDPVFVLIRNWYNKSRSDLAGPGFYMSASLFDSMTYGRNLLVVEVSGDEPFPINNHKEEANLLLDSGDLLNPGFSTLPTAVSYQNTWHCLYRAPVPGERRQVTFHVPRQGDGAIIAHQLLKQATTGVRTNQPHEKANQILAALLELLQVQSDPSAEPATKELFAEIADVLVLEVVQELTTSDTPALTNWLLRFAEIAGNQHKPNDHIQKFFLAASWQNLMARPLENTNSLSLQSIAKLNFLAGRTLGPGSDITLQYKSIALKQVKESDLSSGQITLEWFQRLIDNESPESLSHIESWILRSPFLHWQSTFNSQLSLYKTLNQIYGSEKTTSLKESLINSIDDPHLDVKNVDTDLVLKLGNAAAVKLFLRQFDTLLAQDSQVVNSILQGHGVINAMDVNDYGSSFVIHFSSIDLFLQKLLDNEATPSEIFPLFQMSLDKWQASGWSKVFNLEGTYAPFLRIYIRGSVISKIMQKALSFYLQHATTDGAFLDDELKMLISTALASKKSFKLVSFLRDLPDDHDEIRGILRNLLSKFPELQQSFAASCSEIASHHSEGLVRWNVLALELEASELILPHWKERMEYTYAEVANDYGGTWYVDNARRQARMKEFHRSYPAHRYEKEAQQTLFHLGDGLYDALTVKYNDLARLFVLMEPLYVSEDLRRFKAQEPWRRFNETYTSNGQTIEQPTWANFLSNWNQFAFHSFFLNQRLAETHDTNRQYTAVWDENRMVESLYASLLATHVDGSTTQAIGVYAPNWDRRKFLIKLSTSQWNRLNQANPLLRAEIEKYFDVDDIQSHSEVQLHFKTFEAMQALNKDLHSTFSGQEPGLLLQWVLRKSSDPSIQGTHAEATSLMNLLSKVHPMENGNGRVTRFLVAQKLTSAGGPVPVALPTNDFFMTADDLEWEIRKSQALGNLWQKMLKQAAQDQVPIEDFFQKRFRGSRLEGLMHIRPLDPHKFHGYVQWLETLRSLDQLPPWIDAWMLHFEQNILRRYMLMRGGLAQVSEVQRFFDLDEAWNQFMATQAVPGDDCEGALSNFLIQDNGK